MLRDVPAEASRRRLKDALPFGLASVFYVVFIARGAFRVSGKLHFSLFDDAMISMTYARNLAHGHGLVWNAGHAPVEGYTNFLWTVWMAGIHLLGLPDRLTSVPVIITGLALLLGN